MRPIVPDLKIDKTKVPESLETIAKQFTNLRLYLESGRVYLQTHPVPTEVQNGELLFDGTNLYLCVSNTYKQIPVGLIVGGRFYLPPTPLAISPKDGELLFDGTRLLFAMNGSYQEVQLNPVV